MQDQGPEQLTRMALRSEIAARQTHSEEARLVHEGRALELRERSARIRRYRDQELRVPPASPAR